MRAHLLTSKALGPIRKFALHIRAHGGTAYIVGGAVRDAIFYGAWRNEDWDIEVHELTESELSSALLKLGPVNQTGKKFGVSKMIFDWGEIDISLPRREIKTGLGHTAFGTSVAPYMGVEAAATRRDFTINSMAFNPLAGELFDPYDGQGDLKRGLLRPTSHRFDEDPLRVLRGMQFASRFNLTATPAFTKAAHRIERERRTLSKERVWAEWSKWSGGHHPHKGIEALDGTGWLPPQIVGLHGVHQDPKWHPEGDVWVHTLLALQAAGDIEYTTFAERRVVVLATLLHDIGKRGTTARSPSGRIISPQHARIGGAFALEVLSGEMHAPRDITEQVVGLVREHMFLAGTSSDISPRSIRRLATRLAEHDVNIETWAKLSRADRRGRTTPRDEGKVDLVLAFAEELAVITNRPKPILMGRHLVALGWKPGPHFSPVLSAAYERQLDGEILSLADAYTYLDSLEGT